MSSGYNLPADIDTENKEGWRPFVPEGKGRSESTDASATASSIAEELTAPSTMVSSNRPSKRGPVTEAWSLPERASKAQKRAASHSKTAPTTRMLVVDDELHSHQYLLKEYSQIFKAQAGSRIKLVTAYRNITTGDSHRYLAFPQPQAKHDPPRTMEEFNRVWQLVTDGEDGTGKTKTALFSTAKWDKGVTRGWLT